MMMTKNEAKQLAIRMLREDSSVGIDQYRKWSRNGMFGWELVACDHRTGYTFVVRSPEEWDETVRAAFL